MRPILWGTIWFVIGGIGWVGFSILAVMGVGLFLFMFLERYSFSACRWQLFLKLSAG